VGSFGYYKRRGWGSRRRLPREPIRSGCVLIRRDHLANVTSLEHERWKRAHPEFCRKMGME